MVIGVICNKGGGLKISVVIPTYNAESYLSSLLDKLYQQTVRNYELLIIDSSSTDRTVSIARQYTSHVRVIPRDEFDHGGTRAHAVEYATGDVIFFFTQDAVPCDANCIEKMVSVFDDSSVAAAYGQQIAYPGTNIFGKHLRLFNYPSKTEKRTLNDVPRLGIKTIQLSNSFAAYRRQSLLAIGNFKSGLILGEDVYAGAKLIEAGYTLVYTDMAKVFHSHSYSLWEEFKRYFDIGVFHRREGWILEKYGRAEGEGKKYLCSEFRYLLINGKWYLLPVWLVRNGMKYLGYRLGREYQLLPIKLVMKLSMHKKWWLKLNDRVLSTKK